MPLDRDILPSTFISEGAVAGLLTCSDSPVKKRCIPQGQKPMRARTTQQAVGDRLVITRAIQRKAKSGFPLYAGALLGTGQVVDPENASYVPVQCQDNNNPSSKQSHDLKISVSVSIAHLPTRTSDQTLIL
jgi:hypothetical protein